MTTVVFRDGVLAGDRRVTEGDLVVPGSHPKVRKTATGWLFGAAGTVSNYMRVSEWAETFNGDKRKKGPPGGDYIALLVSPEGVLYYVEGGLVWEAPKDAPYMAIGSGKRYAYGALAMGATAAVACETAQKFDAGSGGGVDEISIK